ncbi:AAA family ATPase, partial [Listeria monocytogenes]
MLINFDVENFLSFKDNTNFSMETGNRIRKLNDEAVLNVKDKKILKSSIIFGANGAGKTNLIFALMRLKNLIFIANVPGNFQRKV